MKTANTYREEKLELLEIIENKVRKGIKDATKDEFFANNLPFWGDGIINPEVNKKYMVLGQT